MDIQSAEKRQGARLPHWRLEGATYFVTFRLGDSLPASVVAEYRAELAARFNARRRELRRPLTLDEIASIKRKVLRSVEALFG